MLLRFQNVGWRCPRYYFEAGSVRLCPSCLADQRVIHVPWDWSVLHLVRCTVHRRPLLDGCPVCREPDPLTFVDADVRCRSCEGILVHNIHYHDYGAVEEAYRAALAGAAPALQNKATDRELQRFVEEMFGFLTRVLDPCGQPDNADSFSRQDILDIIAVLILNAASSSNKSVRRRRGTRGRACGRRC